MSRIRSIKPEFFTDEDIASLPALDRLAFIGLWTLADKAGRLEDRPKRIKAHVLPYDKVDIERVLDRLEAANFITRYAVGGKALIQVRTWQKHQRPHHTELPSTLPPKDGDETVTTPLRVREAPDGREGKGREGKGAGGETPAAATLVDSKSHRRHVCCGQVCLPDFLFHDFVRFKGGDEQEARHYVEAWWDRLDDELKRGGRPAIGDPAAYLRQRWSESHPTTRPKRVGPPAHSEDWCHDHDPPCRTQADHTRRLLDDERKRRGLEVATA